jgi:hypothetical protein
MTGRFVMQTGQNWRRKLAMLSSAAAVALIGSETGSAQEPPPEVTTIRLAKVPGKDTVRFYSLRLREAGMIKSIPSKVITQGTDWRVFNEMRQELKS